MRAQPSRPAAKRLAGAILLTLAPLPLAGGLEAHLGHDAAQAKTPIFAEASHAGQANHWEAADAARSRRCSDCLAPPQPLEPTAVDGRRLIRTADGAALPGEPSGPTDLGSGRACRSRAPPVS